MTLSIRSRGMTLTPELLDHVERRMRFALSRFGDRLHWVAVRVEERNRPRGGVDQRCTIQLRVARSRPLLVEAVDSNLYAAIVRAAARAGRTTARAIERADEVRP